MVLGKTTTRNINLYLTILIFIGLTGNTGSAWAGRNVDLRLSRFQGKSQKQLLCGELLKNVKVFFKALPSKPLKWVKRQDTHHDTQDQWIQHKVKSHPHLWEVLKINQGNLIPTETNQMAVFNTHESMEPLMKKSYGFCAGHATLKTHLTQLAFYDPLEKFEKPPQLPAGDSRWIKFYVKKIEEIVAGHPTVIPGFQGLYEFTSHPQLSDYFRAAAAHAWVKRASSFESGLVPMVQQMRGKDFTPERSVKFIDDLRNRIAKGYSPKIMFNENRNKAVEDEELSLHVVLALKVYPLKDNKSAVLIWDDKKPIPNAYDYLIINHNSGMGFFWSWRWEVNGEGKRVGVDMGGGRVNQYRIEASNDKEIARIVYRKYVFCSKHPEICTELGNNKKIEPPVLDLPIPGEPWDNFEFWDPNQVIDPKEFGKHR